MTKSLDERLQNLIDGIANFKSKVTRYQDTFNNLDTHIVSLEKNVMKTKQQTESLKKDFSRILQSNLNLTSLVIELVNESYQELEELNAIKEIGEENIEISRNNSKKLLEIEENNMVESSKLKKTFDKMVAKCDERWTTSMYDLNELFNSNLLYT